jgi:hypothetical protein
MKMASWPAAGRAVSFQMKAIGDHESPASSERRIAIRFGPPGRQGR